MKPTQPWYNPRAIPPPGFHYVDWPDNPYVGPEIKEKSMPEYSHILKLSNSLPVDRLSLARQIAGPTLALSQNSPGVREGNWLWTWLTPSQADTIVQALTEGGFEINRHFYILYGRKLTVELKTVATLVREVTP